MPLFLKNIDYLRSLVFKEAPYLGAKLAETLTDISKSVNNVEQQTNANTNGAPQPPPAINALMVSASNGHFQVAINHEGAQFYRGVEYFVEHASNPNFTDSHIVHMGTSRNANLFLGNATRYFKAYAAYPGSHSGPAVFHGGSKQPQPVTGGGAIPAPTFAASQGSGTGTPGQTHSGFGPTPYRTTTGAPPIR